jgi:hypothetical protein
MNGILDFWKPAFYYIYIKPRLTPFHCIPVPKFNLIIINKYMFLLNTQILHKKPN